MNTLYLKKMGMNYHGEDVGKTDCGNYRLRIPDITTADGLTIKGDFFAGCFMDHSKKKPRIISRFGLVIDLCYTCPDTGNCYRYRPDGHGGNATGILGASLLPFYGLRYTLDNILTVVNTFSVIKYDRAEVVD